MYNEEFFKGYQFYILNSTFYIALANPIGQKKTDNSRPDPNGFDPNGLMAGMRDRLIHDYFGVDYDLVWDVAINKIKPPD